MTDKEFTRSLILATMPRLDGYDAMRMENWRALYFRRYGRHLPRPAKVFPNYGSPTYPGHADQKKAA
jgi:hypothetical protein